MYLPDLRVLDGWRRCSIGVAAPSRGLVLCATAGTFSTSFNEQLQFLGLTVLAAVSRLAPEDHRRKAPPGPNYRFYERSSRGGSEMGNNPPVPNLGRAGLQDGRATALTVVLPLRRFGYAYYRVTLWLFGLTWLRRRAFGDLDALRFVTAIRWSLLPKVEAKGRRWLLFESNFDGDWDDYLDSFALAATRSIKVILYGARGNPGLDDPAIFKSYARAYDHVPDYYFSAYPTATAADLRHALATISPSSVEKIKRSGYGKGAPTWTTLLFKISPGGSPAVIDAARAIVGNEILDPFNNSSFVHFARIVVRPTPTGDWLLITVTHDNTREALINELATSNEFLAVVSLAMNPSGVPAQNVPLEAWTQYLASAVPQVSSRALTYTACGSYSRQDLRAALSIDAVNDQWPQWEPSWGSQG
jgi:hypothetical protein